MPSENISDGILSVMLPNTVNNILSRLFQTAFEKQGVSVKYSGLNLNQDKARQRCTGLNLIHYIKNFQRTDTTVVAGYGLPP
ncbi:hypothetical protein [Neisseria meningitidis]|uniref:hypothetical protein n=1 Tax=Neisseria meningitidis TaxID=487 RepID=UPI00061BAEEE|nr:hypothetical protein [Neisseria meningitidis]CKK80108.1 Fnr family transcriptional regulator [Neisseria meningitidis]